MSSLVTMVIHASRSDSRRIHRMSMFWRMLESDWSV